MACIGRVLKDNISLISNDPPSHPDSIGIPKGHPPLSAFLGVPLRYKEKVVGMIGVGNKTKAIPKRTGRP